MHAQHRHAAVNDVHAVEGHDVGDGTAATQVNPAQLRCLEADLVLVQHCPEPAQVLCAGIIGAGLAPGAGEFHQHHALAKIGAVLLVVGTGIEAVKGRADIRGQHVGVGQAAACGKAAVTPQGMEDFCHRILKEPGLHTAGTYAADFFLVHQQAAGCALHLVHLQHGSQGCIGAYPVIMSIGQHHAAVNAQIPCPAGRHHGQLRGDEIILLNTILRLQKFKDSCLDSILFLALQRMAANEDVKVLTLYHHGSLLLHLLLGKVD